MKTSCSMLKDVNYCSLVTTQGTEEYPKRSCKVLSRVEKEKVDKKRPGMSIIIKEWFRLQTHGLLSAADDKERKRREWPCLHPSDSPHECRAVMDLS
ncbi:hypothetical protein PoB_001302800 [Plakobranchus ocellatus]|uniref:Uncharacterized protein n=1 Tax=Plakobranchus ocellatus TaxID=259542 RepID=A0AAV3YVD3_9GAST|nr:hypothetical protein PoB_001302800 [Plakobranchus ocellatus]